MNPSIIESLGKLSLGTIAICALAWILHAVVTENTELNAALHRQIELAERQTEALEQLVEIYSGTPN